MTAGGFSDLGEIHDVVFQAWCGKIGSIIHKYKSMELTTANFDEKVLQAGGLVLVDFWAQWCGPCKMMSPIVDELATEMDGIVVGKVNVDEHPDLARQFNILSIPTFIVFKSGQVVEQFSGSMGKDMLKERVQKHID